MKSVSLLLMVAIAVHAGCGVQCLAADLDCAHDQTHMASEKPACHEQPADSPSPHDHGSSQHDNSNACGLPRAGTEIAPASKFVTQFAVTAIPSAPDTFEVFETSFIVLAGRSGLPPSLPPAPVSILRI